MVGVDCLLELSDLAATQGIEQDMEPFEVRADKTLKNLFVQKFHDIIDVLAQKNGHAKLDRPVLLLSLR